MHLEQKERLYPEPRGFWEMREKAGNNLCTATPKRIQAFMGPGSSNSDNEVRTRKLNVDTRKLRCLHLRPADSLQDPSKR